MRWEFLWAHRASMLAGATALTFATIGVLPGPAYAIGPNPNETVNTSVTPADLAAALVGPGVEVSNVTYVGGASTSGSFVFTDPAVLGFGQGIVLGSGDVTQVVGPNVADDTSTDFGLPGDADLDALVSGNTFDATVLEFEFVPVTNQVVFSYVFASDEYEEWVDTQYNDVFAFFVNGQNCATERAVAGDPTAPFVPVSINSIDQLHRPDLYRSNYPFGSATIDLELDGLTRVLTCQSPVNPGVSNTMKLAIADRGDGVWDSAVFLQAGSLVSTDNPVADLGVFPSFGQAPLAVTATVEGEDPNGLPLTYSLDWGDGTAPSTGALPDETALVTHTYVTAGDFVLTLTVSNGTLTGTNTEDITVLPGLDTTPPTFAPTFSSPPPFLRGATGITASPNASDPSGIASESCDPVDTSTVGAKTLTCQATDNAGNTGSVTVPYVVGFALGNISPAPGTAFRRTAAVPVSFQLSDANGLLADAEALGLRSSISVAFDGRAAVHPNYSRSRNEFTASLKTGKPAAGTYDVLIDVVVGGTTLATATIPVVVP